MLRLLEIRASVYLGYSFGKLVAGYSNGDLNLNDVVNCGLIIGECINMIRDQNLSEKDKKNSCVINGGSEDDTIRGSSNLGDYNALNGEVQNLDIGCILSKKNTSTTRDYFIKNVHLTLGKNKQKLAENVINSLLDISHHGKIASQSVVLKIGSSDRIEMNNKNVVILTPFRNSGSKIDDFLQTVGSLYECGYNPQIKELYPSVTLPVSRETRMISPFIKWRHGRDFFCGNVRQDRPNKREGTTNPSLLVVKLFH
ncbi:hypothetical protein NQ317_011297 [Molorchus minor]|uniref:Uncharacterized protein n=1 Tax=Molorchus minor TaxID=1323400 RepID=A0ABQ9JWD3_9CUCU|nr:hypothetical protein NQ317_011297 [Molorchus minor]